MSGFMLRIYSHRLWVYCVALEHAVMLMRVVLRWVVPETPRWISEVSMQHAYADWITIHARAPVRLYSFAAVLCAATLCSISDRVVCTVPRYIGLSGAALGGGCKLDDRQGRND